MASRAAQLLSSGCDFLTHIHRQSRRPLALASICRLLRNTSLGITFYCQSPEDAGIMGAQCLGGPVIGDTFCSQAPLSPPSLAHWHYGTRDKPQWSWCLQASLLSLQVSLETSASRHPTQGWLSLLVKRKVYQESFLIGRESHCGRISISRCPLLYFQ